MSSFCPPVHAPVPDFKERLKLPLIAGGLIQSKAMAEEILKTGVEAVTISMSTLLKG